jgi:hypothetical protein
MKIFWAALAGLAALGSQPIMAYDESLLRPYAKEHNQSRQRGQENNQPKPWETRPWEQQKATDVEKKTQKERFEQQMNSRHGSGNQNQAKQPQNKWQNKWDKHRTEGEQFNRTGLPPR